MSYTDVEIIVLAGDERLATELDNGLDRRGLGVDFVAPTWESLQAHLESLVSGQDETLVFMSLALLCSNGIDELLLADTYFKSAPKLKPILLVEPWVESERGSVRLVTGFGHMMGASSLDDELGPLLEKLLPGFRDGASPLSGPMPALEHSASKLRGSSPRVEPKSDVRVDLEFTRGELADTWLARVLYGLYVRAFTGELVLQDAEQRRSFFLRDGQLGGTNPQERDKVLSTFAWFDGTFEAIPGGVPPGFVSFGSTLELIYEGTLRFVSLNRAAERLQGFDHRYPVCTEFFEDRQDELGGLSTLTRFCRYCAGQRPWGKVISVTWDDIREVLKVACYALDTDLVVLCDEPMDRLAKVGYTTRSTFNVRKSLSQMIARTDGDSDEEATTARLQQRLDHFNSIDAYELFGLEPGCGGDAVRERYYKLVKHHHPDVVGGNISSKIKALAELIFIHIKDAYVELLSLEKSPTSTSTPVTPASPSKGTRAPGKGGSAGPSAHHSSSVRRAAPSSAQRAAGALVSKIRTGAAGTESNGATARPTRLATGSRKSASSSAVKIRPARSRTSRSVGKADTVPGRRVRLGTSPDSAVNAKPARANTPKAPVQAPTGSHKKASAPTAQRKKTAPVSKAAPSGLGRSADTDVKSQRRAALTQRVPPKQHFKNGERFMRSGQYAKAREAFKHAAKLDDKDPTFRAHYAWARFMISPTEGERAKQLLKECLNLKGRHVEVHVFLGRIYKRENDMVRAMSHFQSAVDADKNCVEAQREIRLHNMRQKKVEVVPAAPSNSPAEEVEEAKPTSVVESFFGKLFSKRKQ